MLDIGLPTLNGIEAARRIRKLSPESKVLFLSQECSADIVEEALRLGAWGYVIKTHAGSELLASMEAVRQGRRFISAELADHVRAKLGDVQTPDRFHPNQVLASPAETGG